jgi:hypothetical protein
MFQRRAFPLWRSASREQSWAAKTHHMKRLHKKTSKTEPFERRQDGMRFAGFGRMHVGNSGGPIHPSHHRPIVAA